MGWPSNALVRRTHKSTRSGGRRRIRFQAHSQKTGIVHDADVDGMIELVDLYVKNYSTRLKVDLKKSAALWQQLQERNRPESEYIEWKQPVIRIIYGGYNPLSIAGSLANGGRFNIGGSQYIKHEKLFPSISVQGCLYAAETSACARLEGSSPIGKFKEYLLIPEKNFQMWNLSRIIAQLDIPGLLDEVNATPMSAAWATQKSPLASQLLATYLRSIGGDGVVFPSTKKPEKNILAFFFRDDEESKKAFSLGPVDHISGEAT